MDAAAGSHAQRRLAEQALYFVDLACVVYIGHEQVRKTRNETDIRVRVSLCPSRDRALPRTTGPLIETLGQWRPVLRQRYDREIAAHHIESVVSKDSGLC